MSTATVTEHAGKGLWVTSGGSEYPITVGLVTAALAHTGPRRFSLDRVWGLERTGFTAGAGALAVGLLAAALAMAERKPGSDTPGPIANTTADPDADPTS